MKKRTGFILRLLIIALLPLFLSHCSSLPETKTDPEIQSVEKHKAPWEALAKHSENKKENSIPYDFSTPRDSNNSDPKPVRLGTLDSNSLIIKKIKSKNPLAQGSLAQFKNKTVAIGAETTENLGNIASQTFVKIDQYESDLRRISPSSGILAKAPVISEDVFEFPDSFILVKSISVSVLKPEELARTAPLFNSFRWTKKAKIKKLDELTPNEQKILDNFIANKLPVLDNDDPLKIAYKDGKEALVKAIMEGKGTFRRTTSIRVPKIKARDEKNKIKQETWSNDFKEKKPAPESNAPIQYGPTPSVGSSGNFTFHKKFLTGFTFGDEWSYDDEWDFCVGSFSASLGASYGFGLRVPIDVTGELYPTSIFIKDVQDKPTFVTTALHAKALDANADFYKDTGLPEGKIFEGNEIVLELQLHYRFELDLAGSHEFGNSFGFDWSRNVIPPFGDYHNLGDIPIPVETTQTQLGLGPLSGYAQLGFNISGNGEVNFNYQPTFDGRAQETKKLSFLNDNGTVFRTELPLITLRNNETFAQKKFGFVMSNPSYSVDIFVTPEVKIGAEVDYALGSAGIDTGWILLNSFKVKLGEITLDRHAGTLREFGYADGVKRFEQISGPSETIGDLVVMQSEYNSLYVGHAAEALRAESPDAKSCDKFKIVHLPNGKIALMSSWGFYNHYTTASAESFLNNLMQVWGRELSDRNRLEMIKLPGNKYAFKMVATGKYLTVDRNDNLIYAKSDTIGPNERFILWPVQEIKVITNPKLPDKLIIPTKPSSKKTGYVFTPSSETKKPTTYIPTSKKTKTTFTSYTGSDAGKTSTSTKTSTTTKKTTSTTRTFTPKTKTTQKTNQTLTLFQVK